MTDDLKIIIKKAGGAAVVARDLGITVQAISKWDKVPAARVLDIERLTGVSRHELRADIFGASQ